MNLPRTSVLLLATFVAACAVEVPPEATAESVFHALPDSAPAAVAPRGEPSFSWVGPRRPEPIEPTWFHGVEHLPPGHPCHDDALVMFIHDDCDCSDCEERVSVMTYREARAIASEHGSAHVGQRTVRGVRWETGDDGYMVTSCTVGGAAFGPLRSTFSTYAMAPEADWSLHLNVEASRTATGQLHWMHRAPNGEWHTIRATTVSSGDDEGNDPEYTAWASVLSADDDGGGVWVTALTVEDCRARWNAQCQAERGLTFVVRITTGDANERVTEAVLLDDDGVELDARHIEPVVGTPSPRLLERLQRDRDSALARARAMLRDRKKERTY